MAPPFGPSIEREPIDPADRAFVKESLDGPNNGSPARLLEI
jgi:hypothetical protein